MFLFGTLVNVAAVAVAGSLGTLLKKGIPERITKTVMYGMALCVAYIALDGLFDYSRGYPNASQYHILIPILSVALGALCGELIDIDKQMNRLGAYLERRIGKSGGKVAEGFTSCTVLFCVGAMAIVGSIQGGLFNSHEVILAKTVIDTVSCFVLATSLGIGCALSAIAVLLYQGGIATAAYFVGKWITGGAETAAEAEAMIANLPAINEMNCVGSLIILAIALNMLGAARVRVANLLPALFLPFLFCLLF